MKTCFRFLRTGGVLVLLFLFTGMAQGYVTVSGFVSGDWITDSSTFCVRRGASDTTIEHGVIPTLWQGGYTDKVGTESA